MECELKMIEQCWLFHCGYSRVPEPAVFEEGNPASLKRMPFLCALLVHETLGPILIDAPFGHEGPNNAGALLGQFLKKTGTSFESKWAVSARVEQLGFRPSQVNNVLMTHLHFDHTGGMKAFSHAVFRMNKKEWNFANSIGVFDALRLGYVVGDFRALKAKTELFGVPKYFERDVEGHDVFGDGSVEAISLPGHSIGHTGYRFRLPDGRRVFFLGDAIFNVGHLKDRGLGMMPKLFGRHRSDVEFTVEELQRYAKMYPDEVFICSHDFDWGDRCMSGPVAVHVSS